MKKTKLSAIVFLLMTILWCAFIWSFSFDSAEKSRAESDKVTEFISGTVEHVSGAEITVTPKAVRKTAHFFEFSVLGILLYMTVYFFGVRRVSKSYAVGACTGLSVALTDEFLQLFSEGRSAQLSDIILDMAGVMFTFSVCAAVFMVCKKKK